MWFFKGYRIKEKVMSHHFSLTNQYILKGIFYGHLKQNCLVHCSFGTEFQIVSVRARLLEDFMTQLACYLGTARKNKTAIWLHVYQKGAPNVYRGYKYPVPYVTNQFYTNVW